MQITPELAARPVAEKQPQRSDLDLQIDTAYHQMVTAITHELVKHWADTMTGLVNRRNELRTPAEIERIEREKGLR